MRGGILNALTLGSVFIAAWHPTCTLASDSGLKSELQDLARNIATLLKEEKQESLALGAITGPPNFPASGGAAIAKILTDELAREGIAVKRIAPLGFKAEYQVAEVPFGDLPEEGPRPKRLTLRIRGELVEELGRVVTNFNFKRIVAGKFEGDVPGEQALLELIGVPVAFKGDESEDARQQRIREGLRAPKADIRNGTQVAASADSPYAVEVVVNGAGRSARLDEGLPFVRLNRGEEFQIRLHNRSRVEASVQLSIDGLSVFEFSEMRHESGPKAGDPLYRVYIVPPGRSVVIRGWHKTNQASDAFLITDYAKGSAVRLGRTDDVGTITALFAESQIVPTTDPSSALPAPPGAGVGSTEPTGPAPPGEGSPAPRVAVTQGRRIVERITPANPNRVEGPIAASVSIRYAK